MTLSESFSSRSLPDASLLGHLAEEYLAARLRGETPDLELLAVEHSDLGSLIRNLFPAMQSLRSQLSQRGSSLAGTNIGDYELIAQLGRGGMGVVYEAKQLSLNRRVAVKLLPFAGALDERRLRRFQLEAQAAAALQHPHIVPVYGFGCDAGIHYYAMRLIEGDSLAAVLKRTAVLANQGGKLAAQDTVGPISRKFRGIHDRSSSPADYRAIARLAADVARALEYAHRQGVIHRDVKPANLLLDQSGAIWVTDFGLARTGSTRDLTLSGDLLGTLRYMSPEQFGDPASVDCRADVYSLGITLYEMLTGQPAIDAPCPEQIVNHVLDISPVPPHIRNRRIPVDLETIVLRSIAKDRRARYQSAGELADELERFLQQRPIVARRPSSWQRVRYWAARNRSLAVAVAGIASLLVVLAVAGPIVAWRQYQMASQHRWKVNVGSLNQAFDAWYSGNVDLTVARLAEVDFQEIPERGFAQRFLQHQVDEAERRVVRRFEGPVCDMAISPDGHWLAVSSAPSHVDLLASDSMQVRAKLHVGQGVPRSLAFLPDGRLLAATSAKSLVVWDRGPIASALPMAEWAMPGEPCSLAVLPDGQRIAIGLESGQAAICDDQGRCVRQWSAHGRRIPCVTFSPDGRWLVTCGEDALVRIWDVASGGLVHQSPRLLNAAFTAAFSSDGEKLIVGAAEGVVIYETRTWSEVPGLYYSSRPVNQVKLTSDDLLITGHFDNLVQVWGLDSGYRVELILGHRDHINALVIAPGGREVFAADQDGAVRRHSLDEARRSVRQLDSLNTEWTNQLAVLDGGNSVISGGMSWLPDGGQFQPGRLRRIETSSGRIEWQTFMDQRTARSLAASSDGLLAVCGKGQVSLYDAATGRFDRSICERVEVEFGAVSFSPNGQWLAALGVSASDRASHPDHQSGQLTFWNRSDGFASAQRLAIPGRAPSFVKLVFSRGGERLLVCGAGQQNGELHEFVLVKGLWTHRRRVAGDLSTCPTSIHVTPDGRSCLITDMDGWIRSVELESGGKNWKTRAESQAIFNATLSPDGQTFVTGADREIKMWDLATADLLGNIQVPMIVVDLAFTLDGSTLIWAGGDGQVRFERVRPIASPSGHDQISRQPPPSASRP